jgi:hypothetical protein
MSEQELRDGLKSAVADEPPMAFDVDELVGQAERLVRRRRALVAVGMGTAAVAIAAVAVPVALGIAGGPVELPTATTPTVQQLPPASTVPQLRERGSQMQVYLKNRLPQVVPGAVEVDPRAFGGEAEGDVSDGQQYLSGFTRFKLGEVQTAIDVHVQSASAGKDGLGRNGARYLQQDGSEVLIDPGTAGSGNDAAMRVTSATHYRKDGSITRVTAYNYDPTDSATPKNGRVALDDAQLMALATDPQLHL